MLRDRPVLLLDEPFSALDDETRATTRNLVQSLTRKQKWATVLVTHHADDIAAIGLTGQMHGLTTLDKNGNPLRPALLWNDQRSGAQCDEITEKIGAEKLYQIVGTRMLPGFTLPKLMWVRDHEPEIYKQIAHILLPKDYVRYRLSDALVVDVADRLACLVG